MKPFRFKSENYVFSVWNDWRFRCVHCYCVVKWYPRCCFCVCFEPTLLSSSSSMSSSENMPKPHVFWCCCTVIWAHWKGLNRVIKMYFEIFGFFHSFPTSCVCVCNRVRKGCKWKKTATRIFQIFYFIESTKYKNLLRIALFTVCCSIVKKKKKLIWRSNWVTIEMPAAIISFCMEVMKLAVRKIEILINII